MRRDGLLVAVEEHEDGTLIAEIAEIAEIDDGDQSTDVVPGWLDVVEDVTADEAWTGARLDR